jgi:TRAP-type C4-dicarboxylate transport system substrate-binding protein
MRWWSLALGIALLLMARSAQAGDSLTIATLAPQKSAWGKVFSAWAGAVHKKTNGRLELRFYWNGAQGDETTLVAKLRSGQIDGCTLGASGLGEIHQPALALQLPGLFRSWKDIDRATAELRQGFDQRGFHLSSIGDVGRARTLSKGRAIRTPEDLKGMKPFSPRTGVIAPVLSSVLGITPVRLGLPELLPALSAGRVNVIVAPALATEQLQWAPHLDHVGADVAGIGVGAMVLSKKAVDRLPGDAREVMRKTGDKAGAMLRERVRKMDDEAYQRLARRMTVVRLTPAEIARWDQVFAEVRRRLAQRTFSPALVRRLEELASPRPR